MPVLSTSRNETESIVEALIGLENVAASFALRATPTAPGTGLTAVTVGATMAAGTPSQCPVAPPPLQPSAIRAPADKTISRDQAWREKPYMGANQLSLNQQSNTSPANAREGGFKQATRWSDCRSSSQLLGAVVISTSTRELLRESASPNEPVTILSAGTPAWISWDRMAMTRRLRIS